MKEKEKIENNKEENIREILSYVIENKLDERERLIISLIFYEELSAKEVAEIFEWSESKALDFLTRTIKKIEKLFAKYLSGERVA
jgi:RNA polymerase sigma factor for flagellar operon FliA